MYECSVFRVKEIYKFKLPADVTEPIDDFLVFLQIFLHFFAHIKNGTVLIRAYDVFVQRALTPLTLCPEA